MNKNIFITQHANGERLEGVQLERHAKIFKDLVIMRQAFDATNIKIIVLNQYRQIVYANKAFLNGTGLGLEEFIGKRPGEAMYCVHSDDNPLGCGTSEACRVCEAINTVLNVMQNEEEDTREVAILHKDGDSERTLNLLEHVYPIKIENKNFYVLSLVDISDTVKRRSLERIFFHDVINTAGALGGYIKLLKEESPKRLKPEIEFVADTFDDLVEEIQVQRQLLDAENDELVIDVILIQSCDMLNSIQRLYEKHEIAEGKRIIQDLNEDCIVFKSDFILLKRVIGNMVKNALEETDKGGVITIGCRKLEKETKHLIEFWVNNIKYMEKDVQNQVFKRAFSTKGTGRGLGTYSMKLLGEKYLKGSVGFTSDKHKGTTFYIRLPLDE